MWRVLIFSMIMVVNTLVSFSQEIQWMSLEQAMEKSKAEPKKIFMDMYTDWCRWCKVLDSTTFIDTSIVNYINNNFYAVKFDAEQQDPVIFRNKTYKLTGSGDYIQHEFSAMMLRKNLFFPSMVILDEQWNSMGLIQKYVLPEDLMVYLQYYGNDRNKTMSFKEYRKQYPVMR